MRQPANEIREEVAHAFDEKGLRAELFASDVTPRAST
jgi:hypothetical protein